ncbi:MAG: hypothetical protein Q4C95_02110 [Planctomycetia bacterium]|nr:hypothetical protein [Planctomycetia bacterium]
MWDENQNAVLFLNKNVRENSTICLRRGNQRGCFAATQGIASRLELPLPLVAGAIKQWTRFQTKGPLRYFLDWIKIAPFIG